MNLNPSCGLRVVENKISKSMLPYRYRREPVGKLIDPTNSKLEIRSYSKYLRLQSDHKTIKL